MAHVPKPFPLAAFCFLAAGLDVTFMSANDKEANQSAPAPTHVRTWTDSTGKHTTQAELVRVDDGKVELRKQNGATVTIPLSRLSKDDRRFANVPKALQNVYLLLEQAHLKRTADLSRNLEDATTKRRQLKRGRVRPRDGLTEPRLHAPAKGDPYYAFPTAKSKRNTTAAHEKMWKNLQSQLRDARKADRFAIPAISVFALHVGDVGRLDTFRGKTNHTIWVFQIIDADNMLVRVEYLQSHLRRGGGKIASFSYTREHTDPFWINGMSTTELVDDRPVKVDGIMHVKKTTAYNTRAGRRTVFVLEYLHP